MKGYEVLKMNWKDKYIKALREGKQLIGDKVMRDTFMQDKDESLILQEVVFPNFRADLIEFDVNEGAKNYIIGYEVKSDRDTLDRLESQLKGYLTWCNYVFVLATLRHKKELLKILDSNEDFKNKVGVRFYMMSDFGKYFMPFRTAKYNDVKGKGLNIDWITRNNKLFRWNYLLRNIYGIEL